MTYFLASSVVFFIVLNYSEAQNEKPILLGCYKDYPARKLKGISYEDKAITLNNCFKKCLSQSFPYTALSRNECHCTRHPELLQYKVAESECNTACSGDVGIKCGGMWRISVYHFLPECHEVSTLRYLNTVYLGCYSDTYDRKLHGYNFTDKALTPEICKKKCMDEKNLFAGLQEGIYCYCGNQQPLLEDKVSEQECKYSCKGHHCKEKKCGGDMKNAIYAVGECISISEEYREVGYMGCFKDSPQTDLYTFNISSSKLEVYSCLKECKKRGFMYAALHAGKDCLCGNRHAAFADKQVEAKCNILCIRDTFRCGGEGMSNVYALEQICLAVAPVYTKQNYLGCFLDTPSRRLNGYYFASAMTPARCIEECQIRNFIFAGLQNGGQCFCGNEELYTQERKPESECTTKCTGDQTQNCGGYYRNGIYEAGMCVQVKEAFYAREEQFLGCYKDPGEGLVGHSFTDTQLTMSNCFSECKGRGYVYAGIHAAKTCYCGNNHIPFSKKTAENDCDMFCGGGKLRCGGENRFNLFNLQQFCEKVAPVNTKNYLGCYLDDRERKLKKEENVDSSTPERCIQRCLTLGYIYAGVQNGVQCFCGNDELLLEDRKPELDCNVKCWANISEICGGFWRNSVYEAGKCVQVRFSHNRALQLGCYKIHNESLLGYKTLLHPTPSSLKCIKLCRSKGYKYAAMEGGKLCLCENQNIILENKVADTECDKNCAGDIWKCGGNKRVNLFNVLNCNKVIPDEYHTMYYGCFIDTINPPTFMGDRLYNNMTPEKCIKHCQQRGFYYAALQNGNECHCSDHDIVVPVRINDVYCNLKCTGDSSKTCGGYSRNAVYIVRSCLHVTYQKRPDQYLGCFKEDEYQNYGHQYTYPYLTPHNCIRECKKRKFLYAGMESGDNCKCWIDQRVLLHPTNERECDIKCPGRETVTKHCETELITTKCGGNKRINLYNLVGCEKVEPIEGNVQYLGCMVDDPDRRLKGHYFIDEKLTPWKCLRECQHQGFLFAGLQEGIYCFCGNEQEALKQREDKIKCNTPCAGDITKQCGGRLVQHLYLVGICTEASTFEDYFPSNR